jgi:HEAT repeat protein
LRGATNTDSPKEVFRVAALQGLGALGDERAVPLLLEWTAPGKPLNVRQAGLGPLGSFDKKNKQITQALISYLKEPYFQLRFITVFALGGRGDADAIAPLECGPSAQPQEDAQVAQVVSGGAGFHGVAQRF